MSERSATGLVCVLFLVMGLGLHPLEEFQLGSAYIGVAVGLLWSYIARHGFRGTA